MALQMYNSTIITGGTAADLGTTDDLYVGKSGFLGSTGGFAVYGSGSDHEITVQGELAGSGYAIYIANYSSPIAGETVTVGTTGSLSGSYGIYLNAHSSSIENDGVIRGSTWGISMTGNAHSGQSSLSNYGLIVGGISRDGSEDFELVNEGTIRKEQGYPHAYVSTGTGDQTIENSGVINGNVVFADGNDVYDGREGVLKNAYVSGGMGDDTLLGGMRDEVFIGGVGADTLKGGGGADHFIFDDGESTTTKAGRDIIKDFSHAQQDILDLAWVDAIPSNGIDNDDEFSFIGKQSFSGEAGELRFSKFGDNTLVSADFDGDKLADFAVELQGRFELVKGDFVL
ncbi:hypothetical protein IHQ71_04220 [Rhizobium sp. TH2]|uniref:M10 family metallopeptidase C-terminal domain-containing protein n=1 Tax=Rhizobium sp. TH2 TaxID=2775403 RepID=UPI002157072A|nr:hypothetical protein [Rhizobium sp. TH2]UVC09827.1 hypothetical protein IHQ71_04220 [Rhizobium sp. TH2]